MSNMRAMPEKVRFDDKNPPYMCRNAQSLHDGEQDVTQRMLRLRHSQLLESEIKTTFSHAGDDIPGLASGRLLQYSMSLKR